jgi:hypothetical protein
MRIGIQPRPKKCKQWPQIKAWLEPAAKLGGVPILEKHEVIGAATARILPEEKLGEVVLVGGKDYKKWIGHLDWLLGCWFKMEGMTAIRAYGRKGWRRDLLPLGWHIISEHDKVTAYERPLQ